MTNSEYCDVVLLEDSLCSVTLRASADPWSGLPKWWSLYYAKTAGFGFFWPVLYGDDAEIAF
jgi:hypothetical protein